ncbi:MAG: helix-turn-helix domain-containing protein [Microcystis aeruginosa]
MEKQAAQRQRRRGAILSKQGLAKLHHAKTQKSVEQNLRRYTLEYLSEITGLTPNTLSKIFMGSIGVDKQTLQKCFHAFDLLLENSDYYYLEEDKNHLNEPILTLVLTDQQIQELIKRLELPKDSVLS